MSQSHVKLRPEEGYNKSETLSHMCSKTGGETRPTVLQCQAPLSTYIQVLPLQCEVGLARSWIVPAGPCMER